MANEPQNEPESLGQKTEDDSRRKMLQGSAWMTAGSIFSRLLGAVYVIPWSIWLGTYFLQANALYAKGYQIYTIFLAISTAGIPGAISKQVAHYNARNEYATGRKLFNRAFVLMAFMGIFSALLLYLIAPLASGGDDRLIPVFRALSWALLIIPVMSIMRGFFQGYSEMAPSAISQFIEQVARVIYMLATAYLIMRVLHGSYVSVVSQSNFAAFIGAIFGLGILIVYYLYRLPKLNALAEQSDNNVDISTNQLLKDVIRQAIPFIVMDSGITLFYLIDQYTFNGFMHVFVNASRDQLDALYALFAANANKLIMITISLSTAMAVTAVPLLSTAHAKGKIDEIGSQISNIIQLFFFIMIPAAFGLAAVAQPLYTVFYTYNKLGILVLQFSSYVSIVLGLFTVLGAIMQGLYNNKKAILYLFVGIAVKAVLQFPSIAIFREFGPMISTGIGTCVVCYLMMHFLNRNYKIKKRQTWHRLIGTTSFSVIMFFAVLLSIQIMNLFINPDRRVVSFIELMIAVIIGVAIYGYLILKTRLADKFLGVGHMQALRRRFRIK